MTSDKQYVVLAHGLDTATADRIRAASTAGDIEGVVLEPEPVRVYPHEGGGPGTTLAAQVLGFVNRDGVGQYGVEQYYQELLNGKPHAKNTPCPEFVQQFLLRVQDVIDSYSPDILNFDDGA